MRAVARVLLAVATLVSVVSAPARTLPKAPTAIASCSWDNPGHSPFMGDVVAAVDRYQDIPPEVRGRLKQRMQARQYDEFVTIRRDSIEGANAYDPRISEMHFGDGRVCRDIDRSRWTPQMTERGLVYCESGHCVLVPTVCRNVSRISRTTSAPPVVVAEGPPAGEEPLVFEPPGAGGGESFNDMVDQPPPGSPPPTPPPSTPWTPPPWWPPLTPPFVPPLPPGPPPVPPPPPPPIPEPETYAMWLVGLGLLGWRVRRTRS